MSRSLSLPVAALIGIAFALPAHAVEFNTIDAAKSQLGFSYQQMGVKMDGQFGRFAARLKFDPAKPAAAQASFDVQIASVDAGSPDANKELAGKDWFDSTRHPLAQFVATRIAPLGGNRYQANGQLTIKGRTREVSAPVTFTPSGNGAVLEGSFSIQRSDFAIGEGAWADVGIVANPIQIRFKLLAEVDKAAGKIPGK